MNETAIDFCVELPRGEGAPEWVQLLPAGPEIEGRDGRKWKLEDAAAVAAASMDGSADLPIDWNHAGYHKAAKGEEAPAAGWITGLEVRNGALWGKVDWTERGKNQVEAREYRYLSPEFIYGKTGLVIKKLVSAALTNQPNLRMRALNQEGQGDNMDIKKILKALGLAEDATEDQAVTAINTLKTDRDSAEEKARNSAGTPSLEKFVPRADYDQAVQRATNAEEKVAAAEKQAQEHEIEGEISKALEAGKITPATADYHRAQCRVDGGLERFREYVKTAPEVAKNTNLEGKASGAGAELTGDAAKIASMFGHTAEDLKEYR